ncbi:MAG: hypothetical protein GX116_07535 [Fibrobacter sp.]|nr:hypothetical protein [Fibrobacter sp.]
MSLVSSKIKLLYRFSILSFLFVLLACKSEVEVNYKLNEPVVRDMYTEGYYATIDLEGEERIGTITAVYTKLNYKSNGDTLELTRHFEIDKSKGYLKNYMPSELLWRIREVSLKAIDREVLQTTGFNLYDTLLHSLSMPTRWRDQLAHPENIKHLIRNEKHRWEMTHLLQGPVPVKANITELLRERGRLNFALIQIDSVVTNGFHNLDSKKCLGYTVHLHERESFPYFIWEQHVNSKIGTEKYQTYHTGLEATYYTQYWVAIDPSNGIPCQEREFKQGLHTMINPNTLDTATFKSNISLERLYTSEPKYKSQD